MSAQKRPAADTLLPHRLSKHPRRALFQDAPPEPSLGEQWLSLGSNLGQLVVATASSFFAGASKTAPILPTTHSNGRMSTINDVNAAAKLVVADDAAPMPPPPPRTSRPAARTNMPPPPVPVRSTPSTSTTESDLASTSTDASSVPSSRASSAATSQSSTPVPMPSSSKASTSAQPLFRAKHAEDNGARSEQTLVNPVKPKAYPRRREHILATMHRVHVEQERRIQKENMLQELYELKRSQGYESNFDEFRRYLSYQEMLRSFDKRNILSPSPSLTNLRSKESSPTLSRSQSWSHLRTFDDVPTDFVKRALDNARATMHEPIPPKPFSPSHERLLEIKRAKDARIEARLRPKPLPLPAALPPDADAEVSALLQRRGVIAKFARETVTDQDIARLRPAQWLNDEIINFYGALILARAEGAKENQGEGRPAKPGARGKPLNAYYFSSFFWEKLIKDGYEAGRLGKWTKKVDIFAKDVLLIPVNHNNAHWTAAAVNFRRKRIESYDSMGLSRENVYKVLRQYLDAEHRNKKKKPFDFTGWEDYELQDTPQQENFYDCGVFTCQFMEALSRGEDVFNFKQANMSYFRRRMVWEIAHTTLRDE